MWHVVIVIFFTFQLSFKMAASDDEMSCSSLFCRDSANDTKTLEDIKCYQLMNETDDCVCTPCFKPGASNCDGFISPRILVHLETDSPWFYSRAKLLVIIKSVKPDDFDKLIDRFFRYLSLSNITDFALIPFCGLDELGEDCTKQFYYQMQRGTVLKLSNDYGQNKVESLTLTKGCIGNIKGKFSTVFPNIRELRLNQNNLHNFEDGVFDGLTVIKKLDLSCNNITNLGNGTIFKGLSSLKYLDLSLNSHLEFSANCFDELVNLQVLNISYNYLVFDSMYVFRKNTELRVLELSSCGLGSLTFNETGHSEKWIFEGLTKLENLSLDNNRLTKLPLGVFRSNTNLRSLSLRRNSFIQLSDITQHLTNIIANLDLSENCLKREKDTNSFNYHKYIEYFVCQICCLESSLAGKLAERVLLAVDYTINPIRKLDMEFLQQVAHLTKLHLSDNTIKSVIWDPIFGFYPHTIEYNVPSQLSTDVTLSYPLYAKHNMNTSQTHIFISDYAFLKCAYITLMRINLNITQAENSSIIRSGVKFFLNDIIIANTTYLSDNETLLDSEISEEECDFIFYCPQNCSCKTRGFSSTTVINCTGQSLTNFPSLEKFHSPVIFDLSNNLISDFQNVTTHDWFVIKELYLHHNNFENLEHFQLRPNLFMIDVRNNRLKDLRSLLSLLLPKSHAQIRMSQNPWLCDCNTPEIKKLMNTKKTLDFQDITCTSIDSGTILTLGKASDDELCPSTDSNQLTLKIVLPVFTVLVVSLSACIIVCYRYQDFIKLWLFTRGYCMRWVTEEDIDANKKYDAFVSYSSIDEDWVGTHLVPALEKEKPFYKLCLHNRDWPVGDWIIEQIFKSVQASRRTIIVLTQNFVDSMWSRMEFDAAYQQALTDQVNRVLIVVPGEIPEVTKLGNDLKHFITLNTYIKWNEPFFWRKLRCAMPRVNQVPERNHLQETTNV